MPAIPRGGGHAPVRPLTEEEKRNAALSWPLAGRVCGYLAPYWPRLLIVAACIFVSSGLALTPAMLMGRIVDDGLIGGDINVLVTLIGLSFVLLVLANLVLLLQNWLSVWVAQHITFDMRNKMFRHLLPNCMSQVTASV